MSALLAVVAPDGALPDDPAIVAMLAAMRTRGCDRLAIERRAGAVLAVSRFDWEMAEGFAGPCLIAASGDIVVAADASLFYRDELARRLRGAGVEPINLAAAELILAGYRAWGDRVANEIVGDFAFVVWDGRQRRLIASRDFVGSRPLHHARIGDALVVASTIGGVRSAPGCPDELDLVALANISSLLLADGEETCYSAISALKPGHLLRFGADRRELVTERVWRPPTFEGEIRPRVPFEEAAAELRELIRRATEERCPRGGPIAVTLSGGWDSPAVYAAVNGVCRDRGEPLENVRPVSLSFPEGDAGREDELIREILGWYGHTARWLDTREIPLFGSLVERASTHDEPFAHPFEGTNAALSDGSRAEGSRVCFTGLGGDHLFGADLSFLPDLLRQGRWVTLAREIRAEGLAGRDALDWLVRPQLPVSALSAIGWLRRGARPRAHLEQPVPPWIDADFRRRHQLADRQRHRAPRRSRGERIEGFERRWLFENAFYARTICEGSSLALSSGVERRTPLIDRRVVEFAATRPRSERRSGRETKRLLRRAMEGALPPVVLAPRTSRTGVMSDYFAKGLLREFGRAAAPFFQDPVLAELGIVDADRLYSAAAALERGKVSDHAGALVLTLRTEAWLRAQRDGARAVAGLARWEGIRNVSVEPPALSAG